MPGMEIAAPERTDTSSGFLGSPSFFFILVSSFFSWALSCSIIPSGYLLLCEE